MAGSYPHEKSHAWNTLALRRWRRNRRGTPENWRRRMRSGRLSMTLLLGGIRGKNNALRIPPGTATVLTFALTEIKGNLARRLLEKNGT